MEKKLFWSGGLFLYFTLFSEKVEDAKYFQCKYREYLTAIDLIDLELI